MAGELIALEGPKAVGKSTLLAALAELLPPAARVVLTKEPTDRFDLSQEQRSYGLALAEAIARDRARHVAEVIRPALAAGRMVICDRYVLSSYAFHVPDGVPAEVITRLNRGFPPPSLNLILKVPASELSRRRGQRARSTRLQRDDPAAEAAAYQRFAELMECHGVQSRVVDNSTMIEHHQIAAWLRDRCCWSAQ